MEEKDFIRLIDCIECPIDLPEGQFYVRKGLVAQMNGFKFIVHSDDHDKHFHVIHRGDGVDARFSFPDIKLINYKNERNKINSRQENNIRAFFKNPYYFEKLKKEIERRNN